MIFVSFFFPLKKRKEAPHSLTHVPPSSKKPCSPPAPASRRSLRTGYPLRAMPCAAWRAGRPSAPRGWARGTAPQRRTISVRDRIDGIVGVGPFFSAFSSLASRQRLEFASGARGLGLLRALSCLACVSKKRKREGGDSFVFFLSSSPSSILTSPLDLFFFNLLFFFF
jgi:hypothetical protein